MQNAATLAKCSQAIKKETVKFLVDKLESCTVESLSVFLELANAVAKACHTEFSSSFTDVGDILLGWRLHPDLVANKQKLTDRIEGLTASWALHYPPVLTHTLSLQLAPA